MPDGEASVWIEIDHGELVEQLDDSEIIDEMFERGLQWEVLNDLPLEDVPNVLETESVVEAMLEDAMHRHRFNHSGGFQTCTDEICDYAYRVLY